jgi:hypothetical protein
MGRCASALLYTLLQPFLDRQRSAEYRLFGRYHSIASSSMLFRQIFTPYIFSGYLSGSAVQVMYYNYRQETK